YCADAPWKVGAARADITPDYPIRLTGYAARKTETTSVAQRIYARALAIGTDQQKPAILITVDNCGVPLGVHDDVVQNLKKQRHIDPDRVAICSTHTHSAPWLKGFAPNIFGGPVPEDQAGRVERYTDQLEHAMVKAALGALDARRPAVLRWGI